MNLDQAASRPTIPTAMHIVIDALLLNTEESYRGAGVSNYSQCLLQALGRQWLAGKEGWRYTAFVNDARFGAAGVRLIQAGRHTRRPPLRVVWEQTLLPASLNCMKADLIHGLVNVLPLTGAVPGVVTVHDLSFLRVPGMLPAAKRIYLAQLCRASVLQARRVIAVSRQTADDLMRLWRVPSRKIDVVYNGVDERFSPATEAEVEAFRQQRGLPARFLLYVGTLEPRKNLVRLLEAFACWRSQVAAADREVKLVVAGGKGWFFQHIFQRAQDLKLADSVLFPGYIPGAELANWYRAAEGFVYPSLLEGFGLPVLEAMACGTPVLCSRIPSLVEVAEKSALMFLPEDVQSLAAGLHLLTGQPGLRQELRRRGLERVRPFGWDRTAQLTQAVYAQALH